MKIEPVNKNEWMPKTTLSLKGGSRSDLRKINHRQKGRSGTDRLAYREKWDDVFTAVCDECGRRYPKRLACCSA